MARAASSAADDPESKASDASNSSEEGSIEPIRNKSAVAGGTRCNISIALSENTLQQSISGTMNKFDVSSYEKRSQSPNGPTIRTPRFFQCKTMLSSPHHCSSLGGEEATPDVSKSRTLVSNDVDITVSVKSFKKQLKNLPLGANDMETIGAEMRARQSTSTISILIVSTITTELSAVERNTSGLRDAVWMRDNTAIEQYRQA
mmetsp:Transcript_14640/g.22631  ORF Transcript_14640/g.22631 Transcript_14640/m.22631 type:complete len:203 (-) Transcript_14640:980-1588(-)